MRPEWIYVFDSAGRLSVNRISPSTARNAVASKRARWVADNAVQLVGTRVADTSVRTDLEGVHILMHRNHEGQPLLTGKHAAESIQEIHDAMLQAAVSKEPRHIRGGYVDEETATELVPYPNESADDPLSRHQRAREADFRWGACSRREDRRAGAAASYPASKAFLKRTARKVFRQTVGCPHTHNLKVGCGACGHHAECSARYRRITGSGMVAGSTT